MRVSSKHMLNPYLSFNSSSNSSWLSWVANSWSRSCSSYRSSCRSTSFSRRSSCRQQTRYVSAEEFLLNAAEVRSDRRISSGW